MQNEPSIKFARDINEICEPLFKKTPFDAFSVRKQYHNIDAHIELATDTKWAEHYFKKKYFDIYNYSFNTIDNFHLWSNVSYFNSKEDTLATRFRKDHIEFNHKKGISIIITGENYKEQFNFSSSLDDSSIDEFSLINLENLRVFILYFKNRLTRNKNVLDIYNKNDNLNYKSKNNENSLHPDQNSSEKKFHLSKEVVDNWHFKLENDFMIDRYYLFDICENTYFTKREIDCLLLFIKGLHAKEIAKILKISFRTVEFYFENIKGKFDCKNRTDLMQKLLTSDLFNAILKTQA